MPGSTPVSAIADADAPPPLPVAPGLLRRVVSSPAGAVGLGLTALVVLMALLAGWLSPAGPFDRAGETFQPPSAAHPFGTDNLGHDVLSGVLHGARASLFVVLGVGGLATVMGLGIGMAAGYGSNTVDDILMRITEVFQVIPRFFLALVVLFLFGRGLDRLVLVLGLTSWPVIARVVRSETLSIKRWAFVDAARVAGSSPLRIITREIMPHVLPEMVAYVSLLIAQALLIEASLGFLGLADPNVMSWGLLAGNAQRFLRIAWWLAVFPGGAIVVVVLGISLLGDATLRALGGRGAAGRAGATA